jgi:hypothetical protein
VNLVGEDCHGVMHSAQTSTNSLWQIMQSSGNTKLRKPSTTSPKLFEIIERYLIKVQR